MMQTLVVNLFGGPGAGKSTTAAGLFYGLKYRGVAAELVLEWAKDKIWEKVPTPLDSLQVWARQRDRLERVLGQVPVVITDGPPLAAVVFARREGSVRPRSVEYTWTKLAIEYHRTQFPRRDIFIDRDKPYVQEGRHVGEKEAREIDLQIHTFLRAHDFRHHHLQGGGHPYTLAAEIRQIGDRMSGSGA